MKNRVSQLIEALRAWAPLISTGCQVPAAAQPILEAAEALANSQDAINDLRGDSAFWKSKAEKAEAENQRLKEQLATLAFDASCAIANWSKYNADKGDEVIYQAEKMAQVCQSIVVFRNELTEL